MTQQTSNDISINEAYKKSAASGFELLYETYYRHVFFFLLNLSCDDSLSFDLTQEVFIKAHREAGIMNYNIKAWLYRVAANEFYQNRRSYASKIRYILKNAFRFLTDGPDPGAVFIEGAVAAEMKTKLRSALQKLGDNDRAVMILKYYDGLSYEEIADVLNIEIGTVMSRLSRAREKMREMMVDDGE